MESIYERIQAAVQPDGTLPEGFFIQPEPENPKALRFADGAQDGIVFYHSGGRGDGALREALGSRGKEKPSVYPEDIERLLSLAGEGAAACAADRKG